MDPQAIARVARQWAEHDPEADCRQWVEQALAQRDWDRLKDAFEYPLSFGTAGLRGRVGAGPARMNLATVSRVTWALGQFLLDRFGASSNPLVIVGFDARPDSARFAQCAAGVLAAQGIDVLLSDTVIPTPLVAFAVRELRATAGVVVTASHNPKEDNGYKVYDDQGVQIVAPWDVAISDRMRGAPDADQIATSQEQVDSLSEDIETEYLRQVRAIADGFRVSSDPAPLRVAYTPLHGVGGSWVNKALEPRREVLTVTAVKVQEEPDGTFPTLSFPNPEEAGVLDELKCTMSTRGIDVGMANDPDADRFALCLCVDGQFLQLSGDAVGLLFADACLRRAPPFSTVVSTVVSSPALEELGQRRTARVVRTLTGFKWLCRVAIEDPRFVFAYEEALGYCFSAPLGHSAVLDKDGICAAAVMCELVLAEGGADGLYRHLCELYRELGYWEGHGRSRRFESREGPAEMACWLRGLRAAPPLRLAHMLAQTPLDFLKGADQRPSYCGASDLLQIDLVEAAVTEQDQRLPTRGRVLIRPSGTEPKLKFYIHLCTPVDTPEQCALARSVQQRVADEIFAGLLALTFGDV